MKISPNNQMVCFGAHGGNFDLELCNVSKDQITRNKMLKCAFTGAPSHLDWDVDSSIVFII